MHLLIVLAVVVVLVLFGLLFLRGRQHVESETWGVLSQGVPLMWSKNGKTVTVQLAPFRFPASATLQPYSRVALPRPAGGNTVVFSGLLLEQDQGAFFNGFLAISDDGRLGILNGQQGYNVPSGFPANPGSPGGQTTYALARATSVSYVAE